MNGNLAVVTTQLGASFVNRHVEDLAPGKTIAVARLGGHPLGGHWESPCPVMYLDRWALGLGVRMARRLGASEASLRDAAVARFLRQHGVTVVLGEFLDQFLDFVPLLDRMRMPYVVQSHGIDVSARLREPGMRSRYLAYSSARAILTRCELHRRRLIDLGLPAAKIHVNHGGVFVPDQPVERGLDAGKRLLALSRTDTKKGPIYLLEAFRRASLRDPDLTLDLVGDGPLLPAVRQFVDAFRLCDRVRLHGFVSGETKKRLLTECGVFVQHSITDPQTGDEEGLPAAIQEAMAAAMAVVSTRHAGIPEAVEEGVTGLLVDEGDVDGMANAILNVAPLAIEMGRQGHQRAVTKHAWRWERDRLLCWLSEGKLVGEGARIETVL